MISVARDDQGAIETIPCDEADDKHFYIDENGNAHKTDKWHCSMLSRDVQVSLMVNTW